MAAPASTTEHVAEVPKQNKDKVYIGNLGFKTSEDAVREFVASAGGNIASVVIPVRADGKRPSGFALVTYEKEEDAANAVEKLQEKELDGRKLRVQRARPDAEVAELNAKRREEREAKREADKEAKKAAAAQRAAAKEKEGAAAPADGEAAAAKPKKRKSKSRTSRRRVPGEEGEDTEEAEGAATDAPEAAADDSAAAKPKSKRKPRNKKPAASEARIDGGETTEAEVKKEDKPVREKKERKPREKKLAPSGEDSKDTLFISNLPYDIDDDALASIFTNLSIEIKSAKVIRSTFNRYRGKKPASELNNPQPRSRGFGFVEVANPAQRDEAVEKAAGTLIASREIGVKVAKEMQAINGDANENGEAAVAAQEEAPTQDLSNIQATPEKATA